MYRPLQDRSRQRNSSRNKTSYVPDYLSIAGGLTNAVSGAIYGNDPLGSLKEAFIKGAKAGAATSGINYLSEIFGGQDEERRSGTLRGSLGLVPFGRANDPRHGCMARNPFGGMTEGGSDYGYQYQIPRRERTVRKAPERFSLAEFGREVVTGFVMGGLASAAFYGAGRAVEAVKSSIRSGCEGGSPVSEKLIDGSSMKTSDALDLASDFLGEGYKELKSNSGRFVSADGTRVFRMGENDILGRHGGGSHVNFEFLEPNPAKPGKMQVTTDIHIFLED